MMKMMINASRVRLAAAVVAVGFVAVFTVQSSLAAFSDTTDNTGNAFSAGTVALSDNDSGVAMFTASNLKPGDSEVGCIEVTYSGSLDADIRLYGAVTGGDGLEAYLDLTVERGSGTCAAFGTSTAVWTNGTDGDLGAFMAAATDYANGADDWAVTGGTPDDTVPYRFTVVQQDDNAAQGLSSTASFTFEAQNS
jgi:predicted ribosomally synthesized peptide with SipW-like signal peptide